MNSPVRRVLGNKDKNAQLNITSPKRIASDSVPNITSSPHRHPNMASASSPQGGIKRKIAEVEDAERADDRNNDSQRTQLLSDDDMEVTYVGSAASNMQQSYDPAATSFQASQNPIEQHFELQQEEMSQRTLDKLNEVPMPQNNSQLPPLKPAFFRDTSAGSVGLSSFVNFEGPPSSQLSDKILPAEASEPKSTTKNSMKPPAPQQPVSEASARKQLLMEKAAELQTRLQLALYKVQTRQTNMPFSRLKVPKPARQRSSSPPTNWKPELSTPRLSSSTIREPSSARTVVGGSEESTRLAEAKIAAARSAAANQEKPPVRNLNSLPVPQLDPSLAKGVRKDGSNKTSDNGSHESQQFPSSPPLSRQPSATSEEHLLPGLTDRQPEAQLSSPPASEHGEDDELSKNLSVSRGEAASGLVQLLTSGI